MTIEFVTSTLYKVYRGTVSVGVVIEDTMQNEFIFSPYKETEFTAKELLEISEKLRVANKNASVLR